jgi:hypothetical protein
MSSESQPLLIDRLINENEQQKLKANTESVKKHRPADNAIEYQTNW